MWTPGFLWFEEDRMLMLRGLFSRRGLHAVDELLLLHIHELALTLETA